MLLNVLVRDYPETLAVLKRHGVETTEYGSDSLEDVLARRSDIDRGRDRGRMSREVSGALREALEWRVSDGP